MDITRLEKDGKVAVVYSAGYGAGWSTSGPLGYSEALAVDHDIALAVLDKNLDLAVAIAVRKFPGELSDAYKYPTMAGPPRLAVTWVDKGETFFVEDENDGRESVHCLGRHMIKA